MQARQEIAAPGLGLHVGSGLRPGEEEAVTGGCNASKGLPLPGLTRGAWAGSGSCPQRAATRSGGPAMVCVQPLPGGWAAQMPFADIGNSSSWGHVEYRCEKGPASSSARVFSQAGESTFLKGFPEDGEGRGAKKHKAAAPPSPGSSQPDSDGEMTTPGPVSLRC